MKQRKKKLRIGLLLLAIALLLGLFTGCQDTGAEQQPGQTVSPAAVTEEGQFSQEITEDGQYSTKDEVALYLHTYHHLPSNFITKSEAQKLGWVSSKGNLWDVAPGKSIGGDYFGNHEGKLPKEKGLKYYECDINFDGSFRGPERIIYSNKWQIYYTGDHYNTFTLLYEED